MPDYPENYPKPLIANYGFQCNANIDRTAMEAGNIKQRRRGNHSLPETFTMQFAIPYSFFAEWQDWINVNAFYYFDIEVVSSQSLENNYCIARSVRFISDLQITMSGGEFVFVTVAAESQGAFDFYDFRYWIISELQAACQVRFSDIYWVPRTTYPAWNGTQWELASTSATQYLDYPSDWLTDGYQEQIKITINGGDVVVGGDLCYVNLVFGDGSTGNQSHAFTSINESFEYVFDISSLSELETLEILFFPSGSQVNAFIENIEFCAGVVPEINWIISEYYNLPMDWIISGTPARPSVPWALL